MTLVSYLLVPILLILTEKKLSLKRIKIICILNAVCVFILFFILHLYIGDGTPNATAMFLWGYFGYWLMKKKLLINTASPSEPSEKAVAKTIEESSNTESVQDSYRNIEKHHSNPNIHYCKKCGNAIDSQTKKCIGCGKQYLRWKKLLMPLLVAIPFVALSTALYYYYSEYNYYKNKYDNAKKEINELEDTLEECANLLEDVNSDYEDVYEGLELVLEDIGFYHEHVVFRSDDGTGLYHKYGCPHLDLSYFWAYNTEYAEQLGFEPCSYCIGQEYPVKTYTKEDFFEKYGQYHYFDK